MAKDYVLIGRHLTQNPNNEEWMVSRGSKNLVKAAKICREREPNSSEVKYTVMTLEKYIENIG
jgi:hypothetical protein